MHKVKAVPLRKVAICQNKRPSKKILLKFEKAKEELEHVERHVEQHPGPSQLPVGPGQPGSCQVPAVDSYVGRQHFPAEDRAVDDGC